MADDDMRARIANLEQRMKQIEEHVQQTRQDAVAARVLAGGADRDVAEIRTEIREFRQATIGTMNALHQDQADLRTEVRELGGKVDRGFAQVRGDLDGMAATMSTIATALHRLAGSPDDDGQADTDH